jgi:hypothetical protein
MGRRPFRRSRSARSTPTLPGAANVKEVGPYRPFVAMTVEHRGSRQHRHRTPPRLPEPDCKESRFDRVHAPCRPTSGYLDTAAQYGITPPSFDGSDDAGLLCQAPIVNGVTEFFAILTWVQCMTAPGPDPFIRPTLTGIPVPDNDSLYVVYVPDNTTINDVVVKTCDDFGAYHFFGATLAWHIEGFFPVLEQQKIPFAVVPADCAGELTSSGVRLPPTMDGITELTTHEIVEAATDPIIVTGWIDNDKLGFNADILTKGEAADICEVGVGDVPTSPVRLTDGLLVATYWSNADNRCVPDAPAPRPPPPPSPHTFALNATGLPATAPHLAQFDGVTVSLPFSTVVGDGTSHSFSFPSPVKGSNPGTRYVTTEPAETVNVTSDFSKTALYSTQHLLAVQATPPAAAALDVRLTPSGWHDVGSVVDLDTDPLITSGTGTRYRFDHWSGALSSTSPHASVIMNGPRMAVANYVAQHLVTVRTQGLGANTTHILNGSTILGIASDLDPLAVFVDDGPLALTADALVDGAKASNTSSRSSRFRRRTPLAPRSRRPPNTRRWPRSSKTRWPAAPSSVRARTDWPTRTASSSTPCSPASRAATMPVHCTTSGASSPMHRRRTTST